MLTGVTRDAFQLARHVDQRFNFFVGFVDFRQLRFGFKRFCQRHARIGRHQLGDTINKPVRVAQHAADVTDNRFRRHRTERNNLRYRITAVHIGDVLDHLVAFLHAEVDVKVGHGNTFRVKETFEQQVEFQRVEIGNFKRVGHKRSRTGTTARTYRHAVILRPLDKLHNDQEVAGEAHLVDHLEFNIQTFIVRWAFLFANGFIREQELQTLFQAFLRFYDQEIFRGHVTRRELRQEVLAETHGDVTAFCYFNAVFQRFRDVREELTHLLFVAHILLRGVVTRTFRIVEGEAVMDRHTNFMCVKITRFKETDIVGGHHRQTALFGECHGGMQIALFVRAPGADQFKIVAIREILFVERDALIHQRTVATQQTLADIAHATAGNQQQAFVQLCQPVAVDPRAHRTISTLIGFRDKQGKVLITGVVHRQHGDLRHFIAEQLALDMKIRADNWL